MPPSDRQQWFYALSEDDLQYLASYHHLCSQFHIHAQCPSVGKYGEAKRPDLGTQ